MKPFSLRPEANKHFHNWMILGHQLFIWWVWLPTNISVWISWFSCSLVSAVSTPFYFPLESHRYIPCGILPSFSGVFRHCCFSCFTLYTSPPVLLLLRSLCTFISLFFLSLYTQLGCSHCDYQPPTIFSSQLLPSGCHYSLWIIPIWLFTIYLSPDIHLSQTLWSYY